jgi:hypothetical protein
VGPPSAGPEIGRVRRSTPERAEPHSPQANVGLLRRPRARGFGPLSGTPHHHPPPPPTAGSGILIRPTWAPEPPRRVRVWNSVGLPDYWRRRHRRLTESRSRPGRDATRREPRQHSSRPTDKPDGARTTETPNGRRPDLSPHARQVSLDTRSLRCGQGPPGIFRTRCARAASSSAPLGELHAASFASGLHESLPAFTGSLAVTVPASPPRQSHHAESTHLCA